MDRSASAGAGREVCHQLRRREVKIMAEEKLIGKITHYYGKLEVAIIELAEALKVGQTVHFKGAHDDFTQEVKELQYEHAAIAEGKPGQQVGIKVDQKVHENDQVFVVV